MTKKTKQDKKHIKPTAIPSKTELLALARAKQERRTDQGLENQAQRYETARVKIIEEGLKVMHLRRAIDVSTVAGPFLVDSIDFPTGGMTVVFRQKSSNSFIEIATALCSTDDAFNRKAGTIIAVENFLNQRVITVPNYDKEDPAAVVEGMFSPLTRIDIDLADAAEKGIYFLANHDRYKMK